MSKSRTDRDHSIREYAIAALPGVLSSYTDHRYYNPEEQTKCYNDAAEVAFKIALCMEEQENIFLEEPEDEEVL